VDENHRVHGDHREEQLFGFGVLVSSAVDVAPVLKDKCFDSLSPVVDVDPVPANGMPPHTRLTCYPGM